MQEKIVIKCTTDKGAILPQYKTQGASGADICAFLSSQVIIAPGKFSLIPTGIYVSIPIGFEIQVRPRSGLAIKNGITVLNTPGTIDSDYRGEIKVILANFGSEPFVVKNGDRIAQIIVSPIICANFLKVDLLDETERGEGGFGSTGVSV